MADGVAYLRTRSRPLRGAPQASRGSLPPSCGCRRTGPRRASCALTFAMFAEGRETPGKEAREMGVYRRRLQTRITRWDSAVTSWLRELLAGGIRPITRPCTGQLDSDRKLTLSLCRIPMNTWTAWPSHVTAMHRGNTPIGCGSIHRPPVRSQLDEERNARFHDVLRHIAETRTPAFASGT